MFLTTNTHCDNAFWVVVDNDYCTCIDFCCIFDFLFEFASASEQHSDSAVEIALKVAESASVNNFCVGARRLLTRTIIAWTDNFDDALYLVQSGVTSEQPLFKNSMMLNES